MSAVRAVPPDSGPQSDFEGSAASGLAPSVVGEDCAPFMARHLPEPESLSQAAEQRLRHPSRRGVFQTIDAARAGLALLSVADLQGQARVYWLVELPTLIIRETRFLAFGSLASHPVADCFCEQVRDRPVTEACALSPDAVEVALRDDPATPAFGGSGLEPLSFLAELQAAALAEIPNLVVPPRPIETKRYERKREADWNAQDRAWLPLSLLKKVGRVQQVARGLWNERLGLADEDWSIEGLHDDFRVVLVFHKTAMSPEDRSTALAMLEQRLRQSVHPHLEVGEEAAG